MSPHRAWSRLRTRTLGNGVNWGILLFEGLKERGRRSTCKPYYTGTLAEAIPSRCLNLRSLDYIIQFPPLYRYVSSTISLLLFFFNDTLTLSPAVKGVIRAEFSTASRSIPFDLVPPIA